MLGPTAYKAGQDAGGYVGRYGLLFLLEKRSVALSNWILSVGF